MEKHYALFWLNSDNFEAIVIDTSGNKTEEQILKEIDKYKLDYEGLPTYYLVEKASIVV